MPIYGPPAPYPPYYIGKGLRGADGYQVMIFGQPLPNDGILGTDKLVPPVSIVGETTLFDVSGLTVNHEVPVVLYKGTAPIYSPVTYTWTWYRSRDNAVVFKLTHTISVPPGTSAMTGAWIGWLSDDIWVPTYPQYREIQENGDYYAVLSASGGQNFVSPPINFAVRGIPPSTVLDDPTINGFTWLVRLSDYFTTSNYIQAGICTQPFTDGQSSPPNGILATANPSSSSGCVATGVVTNAKQSTTYTVYGFAQAANGNYYRAGQATIRTLGKRPDNWQWETAKVANQPFSMKATEWNNFCQRINDFRQYQGHNRYSFTEVTKGQNFEAYMYRQARSSIMAMNPPVWVPPSRNSGDPIYASDLNLLRDSLNSID